MAVDADYIKRFEKEVELLKQLQKQANAAKDAELIKQLQKAISAAISRADVRIKEMK
ncbi:MAG: hypothetical protein L0210_01785 [Rhodospirillales bacterium]|nr:hypothetical protein [Rhodospirillales bacterium]